MAAFFGEIDTYLLSNPPTFAVTTSPSTKQPLLPVTVTVTVISILFFILRLKLNDDSDIESAVYSAGVAVATGVGVVETVGVGMGGGVGGGKVGTVVTVGVGAGGNVGTGVCVAVGVGVTVAPGVAAGVNVTVCVGDGDAAGVGVTIDAPSVVKSQLYAESIVVPAKFAADTLVVTVAVYFVPYERLRDGVKVIVAPFVTTEPLTSPFSSDNLKDSVVTVEPFTYILKVADTAVVTDTPVASLDGLVEFTVSFSLTGSPPPPPPPPPEPDVLNDASLPYTRLV